MNCKKTQELITTDYIDNRIGDQSKSMVDRHLAGCPDCRGFLLSLKNEVINPLNDAPLLSPGPELWQMVKEGLIQEENQPNALVDWWERLKNTFHLPRPAFALASLLTMFLIIGTTGQFFINFMPVKVNGTDQVQYISSLIDQPLALNTGNDPQTPIEQYFL